MKIAITEKIPIPSEAKVERLDEWLVFKGPAGELKRKLKSRKIRIELNGEVILSCDRATKKERRMLYTYAAHIKRALTGVLKQFEYQLKICSSHFPINVTIQNNRLVIKNFLGEKKSRELEIEKGVKVEVKGDTIIVSSPDIEGAGKVASQIELLTKITGRDRRVFQDGIFITSKPGKEK